MSFDSEERYEDYRNAIKAAKLKIEVRGRKYYTSPFGEIIVGGLNRCADATQHALSLYFGDRIAVFMGGSLRNYANGIKSMYEKLKTEKSACKGDVDKIIEVRKAFGEELGVVVFAMENLYRYLKDGDLDAIRAYSQWAKTKAIEKEDIEKLKSDESFVEYASSANNCLKLLDDLIIYQIDRIEWVQIDWERHFSVFKTYKLWGPECKKELFELLDVLCSINKILEGSTSETSFGKVIKNAKNNFQSVYNSIADKKSLDAVDKDDFLDKYCIALNVFKRNLETNGYEFKRLFVFIDKLIKKCSKDALNPPAS